ncbi:biotin/acetyl-CoA-carboxylase ligase [Dehalogenimonas lykanthroporepellens BL-DC-9]|nr:biotin/acetyl-CoA-carboxylase ligase [Dehalogenimonas lykanthroporepellens BL-DC-9]
MNNIATNNESWEGSTWSTHTHFYPSVDSTMDIARQMAKGGCTEGTNVVAARQHAGRGRLSRVWLSPEGSVSMSVVLFPELNRLSHLVMIAGVAVVEALESFTGVSPALKWPNDIIIRGLKLGGILVESGTVSERRYAVIGIGLNVNVTIGDYPEIAGIATSLFDITGKNFRETEVSRSIVRSLEHYYRGIDNSEIFQRWRSRLDTIDRRVTVETGGNHIEGIARDVNPDGSLIIRSDDGIDHQVFAGDIWLRSLA